MPAVMAATTATTARAARAALGTRWSLAAARTLASSAGNDAQQPGRSRPLGTARSPQTQQQQQQQQGRRVLTPPRAATNRTNVPGPKLRAVPPSIPRPDYAVTGRATPSWEAPYALFDPNGTEIPRIRRASRLAATALKLAGTMAKPGVSTDEIDEVVHAYLTERGAYPSPLNYLGFPKSICASVNEVLVHGVPSKDMVLRDGDIVKLDVSCFLDGMHGDCCWTFLVGDNVDADAKRLVETAKRCLDECIALCRPGRPFSAIGEHCSKVSGEAGYEINKHYVGHGLGPSIHMRPLIHHYTNDQEPGIKEPGNVFTIEPILCEKSADHYEWPDRWSAVSRDGSWAAQFEHTLLITDKGVEVLTVPDS